MARAVGTHTGAFDAGAAQDVVDTDALQGPIKILTGTADAINPHVSGNYIIQSASANAITLGAPTAGVDDGLSISIAVDSTSLAHTITATALIANGTALKTTVTPAQFKGAGIVLRAFNGVWHVISAMAAPIT
jgi:hypothetical protein